MATLCVKDNKRTHPATKPGKTFLRGRQFDSFVSVNKFVLPLQVLYLNICLSFQRYHAVSNVVDKIKY